MSITLFTTWATGVFNGCKPNVIPGDVKWSIFGLTTFVGSLKILGNAPLPLTPPKTMPLMIAMFVGSPAITGTVYYTGNLFGKVIRSLEDQQTGPVRFKLV
jgi:hypothetical protein